MKKFFSLIAVLMLLMAMLPTSAMAYEAVTPVSSNVTHTLTLTGLEGKLAPGVKITYNFKVEQQAAVVLPEGGYKNISLAVTGAPSIASIVYDENTAFESTKRTEDLDIKWENVKFMEPGVYTWKVTKEVVAEGTNQSPSNHKGTFYVYAIVKVNGNNLSVSSTGISGNANINGDKDNLSDQYPEKKVNLTIEKQVAGSMASENQYFQFEIELTTLPGEYAIEVVEEVKATAYNQTATTNPNVVKVLSAGTGTKVTVWLKATQTAKIVGLPYGTSYTIVESGNEGFEVSATVVGDESCTNDAANNYKVTDEALSMDTTVTYTNTKDPIVPAGIVLETAAPMMGILLAMSMLAVLYIGKRKESAV